MTLTTPLVTWGCIAALFVTIIIVRLFRAALRCAASRHSIIELCSEREEFFIPGDPDPKRTEDYEDFDDL